MAQARTTVSDTENTIQIEVQSRLCTVQEKAALIRVNWLTRAAVGRASGFRCRPSYNNCYASQSAQKGPLLGVTVLQSTLATQRIRRLEHFRTITVQGFPGPRCTPF